MTQKEKQLFQEMLREVLKKDFDLKSFVGFRVDIDGYKYHLCVQKTLLPKNN